LNPFGVVTTPSFQVQPSLSPDRLIGSRTSVANVDASSRNRVEHVGRVFVAGQLGNLVDAREFAQDELHVAQRRAVGAHEDSPSFGG